MFTFLPFFYVIRITSREKKPLLLCSLKIEIVNLCIDSGRFLLFLKCQMCFSFIHQQNCCAPSQAARGFSLLLSWYKNRTNTKYNWRFSRVNSKFHRGACM